MNSSIAKWMSGLALLALASCNRAPAVGDPCVPTSVPCDVDGKNCGYSSGETYLESPSAQCETDMCVVHRLDNGTQGTIPSDPRVVCEDDNDEAGCVSRAALEQSVHCTCRCDGPKDAANRCECPEGYLCRELVSDDEMRGRGSYCVRR